MANSHFCSQTCIDDAEKKGPMILEVPVGHSTFKSGTRLLTPIYSSEQASVLTTVLVIFALVSLVAEQFKASWRHAGSTCPSVRRVYKIVMQPGKVAAYEAYR